MFDYSEVRLFFFVSLQTRLLVTHGVHFLPQMDQIIVLKEGRITEVCLLFILNGIVYGDK